MLWVSANGKFGFGRRVVHPATGDDERLLGVLDRRGRRSS